MPIQNGRDALSTAQEKSQDDHGLPINGRVFCVPIGQPFLSRLAQAILDGHLSAPGDDRPDPLDLADITLLMPTRRAQRNLADAFLSASGRPAMMLPTITAISERDEEAALISDLALGGEDVVASAEGIAPAIDELARQLLLTRLVVEWSKASRRPGSDPSGEVGIGLVASAGARTPGQAAQLAKDLASLMDLVETEGRSLDGLDELVPDEMSEHWQQTLTFLKIVTAYWPAQLSELALISPAERRNRMILAEANRFIKNPPQGPVIVAGVTGSIPATVDVMRAVLALERGSIVLPSLDTTLDDESWRTLGAEHPQFGLKRLLDGLGLDRSRVQILPGCELNDDVTRRIHFVSEAFRPTPTIAHWQNYVHSADRSALESALAPLSLIEAATAQQEAEVVSLILRSVAETKKTAALVTPDRLLARRVATRLEAWGIRVDDSAGRPFAKTVPGSLLDLVVECLASDFVPADVMSLLKHPLCRLGLSAREVRFAARNLELAAFRTPYIGRGLIGIDAAFKRAHLETANGERRERPVRRMRDDDWARGQDLIARMMTAFAPLLKFDDDDNEYPLSEFVTGHIAAAEAVCLLPDDEANADKSNPLYEKEAGAAAADLLAQLLDHAGVAPEIQSSSYPEFYRSLLRSQTVREQTHAHPRLFIWGPMEARLLRPDIVVLSGLNDGTWPGVADPGPWLNRPMRDALGLPAPEEEIGRKAHDFVSLLGADRVYLTRAKKIDGNPTIPSRWLLRINALLHGLDLGHVLHSDKPWLSWAGARDEKISERDPPQQWPRPPVDARPRKLSVSDVEDWISNPYAIFAKRILSLHTLPQLGGEPDAALKGAIIHTALARFSQRYPTQLPDDPKAVLLGIAQEFLSDYAAHPRIAAFWLPRFERFVDWFVSTEPARREGLHKSVAELSGSLSFDAPAGPFTLTARADRIDVTNSGVVITDYKTGSDLSGLVTRAKNGIAPQLPLEAAIAQAGGFAQIDRSRVAGLRYISASGGEPPGDERVLDSSPAELSQFALDGLHSLVATFDKPTTRYDAKRRGQFDYRYDDYAHLARVLEWSSEGEG